MVVPEQIRGGLALAEQETVLERLEPEQRAAVVLALVALGLLGGLLLAVVMLGGRWARHARPLRRSPLTGTTHRRSVRSTLPQARGAVSRTADTLANLPPDEDTKPQTQPRPDEP